MSRTFEALRKAEADKARLHSPEGLAPLADEPRRTMSEKGSAQLEYEKIRVWLTNPNANGERLQVVMVVACHSGSGGTTTASLLASTLAEARRSRVLLIDSNFRTPGLNGVFKIQHDGGFGEVAIEGMPLETHIQKTDRKNLWVLVCGDSGGSPLDAFDSEVLDELITNLKRHFDFIVFDAAPALDFPDAYALAPKVDGIILVAEAERTQIDEAQRAKRDLERAGGKLLGVVLNRRVDHLPKFVRRLIGAP